ncbi:hypothetical protein D3C77_574790 [compost metagenome]
MLGKASEIKTYVVEVAEKEAEWNVFREENPAAEIIDIKYSAVYNMSDGCNWHTALIIYKEDKQ